MKPSMEGPKKAFLFSSLFSIFIISNATDTITKTGSITGKQTLVSSDGSFEMGFFSPGSSHNFYLGIWYKKIPTRTVVWVANREAPLLNSSGVLKVINPGILVLVTNNNKNEIIWRTNTTGPTQDPVVQLLESGNLILKDSSNNNNNPENFLWQSFDYPCDTLLPGMKLGKNFLTGLERHLSSWRSDNDPAPGPFTYRCDPQGYPQNILSSGSDEQYRTGPWNGLRFSGTPSLKPNSFYAFELVNNETEVYFAYRILHNSVLSRFVVNQSGVVQRWTLDLDKITKDWSLYLTVPRDSCDRYNLCGPYGRCNLDKNPVCDCLSSKFEPKNTKEWVNGGWSNGCVRRTALNCSNGDGFVPYSGFKMPDTRHSWFNRTMNLKECELICLRSCSCTAYTSLDIRGGGSGCLLWYDELIDMKVYGENNEQFIYVRMASSELERHEGFSTGKKRKRMIIVTLALLVGLLLLGLGLTLYYRKKKKKSSQPNTEGNPTRNPEQEHTDKSQKEDLELPLFDLAVIADSTDNFSINNKLGQGGFGPVYKGVLEGGQEIAVKRLSKSSSQGLDEFKNEVICIAKLQHRNLVRLLGCCIEGEEKLLIYEYLPNKSLDYFIFDRTQSTLLDWTKRFHIINGIARGLLYLHQDSRLRVIHRDLKAANILLDIDMNPKISDFGMARSFIGNETEANTNRVVGTHGYMSPEYAVDGQFSVKSDVFSFGVLVLEIVSGKQNRGFYHPDHRLNLLGHAWRLHKETRSLELIEKPLRDSHCNLSEAQRSIHMGLLCVQECPEDRPRMSYVVSMLSSEDALPEPKQPGFYTARRVLEVGSSSSKDVKSSSVNEMTDTLLSGR